LKNAQKSAPMYQNTKFTASGSYKTLHQRDFSRKIFGFGTKNLTGFCSKSVQTALTP
jgi:hypothetical protein